MSLFILIVCLLATMLLIICVILAMMYAINDNSFSSFKKNDTVYCLMITGKTNERYIFAKTAIMNFRRQKYKHKHLIIINEGNTKFEETSNDTTEIMINRRSMTLGDLRNIALELVPYNSIWTPWDDDDWRSDDYISTLYNVLITSNSEMLMYTSRLEYNMNTKFTWTFILKTGIVMFFGFKDMSMKYKSVDYNEEHDLKKYLRSNKKCIIYNNDPNIYIRFVHKDNTSVYVNPNKRKVSDTSKNTDYKEQESDPKDTEYVKMIVKNYYNNII